MSNNFDKIFVNLNAPESFQLANKIAGDNNANLTYIFQETRAKCQLRGRGSGYIESNGLESHEMLHILIEYTDYKSHQSAKDLARNLIETVQTDLQAFLQQSNPSPQIIQQQTSQQQHITIPQQTVQTFTVPPPTIIQQQPTQILQQQSFVPQQIIQQNVPMQIIQQTPINIPPPMRTSTTPIVQFQSQPTTNIIQGTNAAGQIIQFNQAPTQQYQLQYVQPTNQITNPPPLQTIQHLIQPTQQIQGLIQPNPSGQQFITLQGNAASYMIPPPNIIQQQTPPQQQVFTSQQTISINPEDMKSDSLKSKNDVNNDPNLKTNMNNQQQSQQISRIVTSIPPPSVLTCPPPQVFNQQQVASQQPAIQQFILNTQPWPQQQQQQQQQQHIQILTQPHQTIRGNDQIVIQNSAPQQVITFNPQQATATHHQYQQIQVQQTAISQPPTTAIVQQPPPSQVTQITQVGTQQPMTFQQQFELKINASETQQRAVKRKFDSDVECEKNSNNNTSKNFPKTGMGSNISSNSKIDSKPSTMTKNKIRMSTSQPNSTSQQQMIRMIPNNNNNPGNNLDLNKRNTSNQKSNFRNSNSNSSSMINVSAANIMNVNTSSAVETKTIIMPPPGSSGSETLTTNSMIQFHPQPAQNQMGFIMRGTGNQSTRFQNPQNFIHQQPPPPINHNSQFSGPRGQIMSNASIGMFQAQTATQPSQLQMMQSPPPPTTTIVGSHHFIHQQQQQQPDMSNLYQQQQQQNSNNFHLSSSQGNFNRLPITSTSQQSSLQGVEGVSGMSTVNYQQQQQQQQQQPQQSRFRQW